MNNEEIIFHKESVRRIFNEGFHLLEAHYKEVAHYQDIELKPDRAAYEHCEDTGMLHCFTARRGGVLIGYAWFFIKQNMHYVGSKQAYEDIIFISKNHRGFGSKFISWCDQRLAEMGVQVVSHHMKSAHDWSKILVRQGYELVDLVYTKRLDKK